MSVRACHYPSCGSPCVPGWTTCAKHYTAGKSTTVRKTGKR